MQWESLGFRNEPFKTEPITEQTLGLYTGNADKIKQCQFAMHADSLVMVIEGARGLGTTSFANYLRFTAQASHLYLTPTREIRLEPSWNADTLMAAVISNVVSTLELNHFDAVKRQKKFKEAKQIVQQVTETYRSVGASAFGFGATYSSSGTMTQPLLMPTQMLADHLSHLVTIIKKKLGFKYGILIQLNNLDIGVVQKEAHLKMVLNVMRDYLQTPGTSWLLAGDVGIRRFIAQEVDRVDDIIRTETEITSLSKKDYLALIQRRVEYYKINAKVKLPIDESVWLYLYDETGGRLRYIFGLIARLFDALQVGILTDRVTLALARPVVVDYAKKRIHRFNLSAKEEMVLKVIVRSQSIQVKEIAKLVKIQNNYVSRILSQLLNYRLVGYKKEWRNRYYYPSIEAAIAYKENQV